MRLAIQLTLVLHLAAGVANSQELPTITGRIVDVKGVPVAGAAIDYFWSANGSIVDADGKPFDLTSDEAQKKYWSHFGQMEPVVTTTSRADGRFSLKPRGSFHTIMAMNADRSQGGLAKIPKDHDGSEIEIRLQPLVRVQATIENALSGYRPAHIFSVTEVTADPARPLAMCRLVLAEARDSRLLMSLPSGRYVLDAYDDQLKTKLMHKFVVNGDAPEVDLGVLTLLPAEPNINQAIEQSRASGSLNDYTKHYGKKLPAWHIVDARRVDTDVQLSDFEGKWVLVHFWALNCTSCLKNDLPRLTKFYEDHKAQREQFEILAICVDHYGEKKSIADVERALKPIIENVWDRKPLPFPILLDPSMTTLERFGVPGYETLLIDPEGRLVEGDETTLVKRLKY